MAEFAPDALNSSSGCLTGPDGLIVLDAWPDSGAPNGRVQIFYRPQMSAEVASPVLVRVEPDGGPDEVLSFALAEAHLRGIPTRVLCAGTHVPKSTQATIAEALAPWRDKYPDVPIGLTVRPDLDVAIAVTVASRTAALVVTEAGESGSAAASVAQTLVHRAGSSVVLVASAGSQRCPTGARP